MEIVVCVKQVVDTEAEKKLLAPDWRLDRESVENVLNPYDEYAVEEAVRLKEAHGGEVTVLCMGPEDAQGAVRKALAMGADRALMVTDPALAGSDTQGTALALSAALSGLTHDLVLLGIMSTDAQTGQLPSALGDILDLPVLTALNMIKFEDGSLTVHRQTDQGYVAYGCGLPAVCSVVKGINEPRYPSLKGIMGAKKKPLEVKDLAGLGVDAARVGGAGALTKVLSTTAPPPRKAGQKIEDDGTAAQRIVEFLAGEKII
ncbi:MAG: electron transfer flavoprotein subunit beta/FixA family protein [Actinobacteria bacterium]|nr:electron transfer flavoprotein subunit beta/FixA family protein [Actinomycetota bacterium]